MHDVGDFYSNEMTNATSPVRSWAGEESLIKITLKLAKDIGTIICKENFRGLKA